MLGTPDALPGTDRPLVPNKRLMHVKSSRVCRSLKDWPDAAIGEDIGMGVGGERSIKLGEDLRPSGVWKHLEPLTEQSSAPIELIRRVGDDQIGTLVWEAREEDRGIDLHQAH